MRDYSLHDLFYCMSFTVLGLCSLRKNDARLVVLFLAVSFQNFCTNFSNGSDQFAQKTSRKARFPLGEFVRAT